MIEATIPPPTENPRRGSNQPAKNAPITPTHDLASQPASDQTYEKEYEKTSNIHAFFSLSKRNRSVRLKRVDYMLGGGTRGRRLLPLLNQATRCLKAATTSS